MVNGNSLMELNLGCNELQPAELQYLCALKPHLFPHMQKLIHFANTELLDDDPTTQKFDQTFLVGTVLPAETSCYCLRELDLSNASHVSKALGYMMVIKAFE
jgi:hypothetical protein